MPPLGTTRLRPARAGLRRGVSPEIEERRRTAGCTMVTSSRRSKSPSTGTSALPKTRRPGWPITTPVVRRTLRSTDPGSWSGTARFRTEPEPRVLSITSRPHQAAPSRKSISRGHARIRTQNLRNGETKSRHPTRCLRPGMSHRTLSVSEVRWTCGQRRRSQAIHRRREGPGQRSRGNQEAQEARARRHRHPGWPDAGGAGWLPLRLRSGSRPLPQIIGQKHRRLAVQVDNACGHTTSTLSSKDSFH